MSRRATGQQDFTRLLLLHRRRNSCWAKTRPIYTRRSRSITRTSENVDINRVRGQTRTGAAEKKNNIILYTRKKAGDDKRYTRNTEREKSGGSVWTAGVFWRESWPSGRARAGGVRVRGRGRPRRRVSIVRRAAPAWFFGGKITVHETYATI